MLIEQNTLHLTKMSNSSSASARLLSPVEWVVRRVLAILCTGFLASCALPPAPPPAPMEISGVLRDIDLDGRFFRLENADNQRVRTVYWDDSTTFSRRGHEFSSREARSMKGGTIAVLAVPMGDKMIANVVDES